MKLETETIIVLGAIAVVTIGAVFLAKKVSNSVGGAVDAAVQAVSGVINTVIEAPAKAVEAVSNYTRTQGAAIQDANREMSTVEQELTGRKYSNPLMTDDGKDFGQLSG